MRIDCVPSEQSLAHLPRSGRVIIVANHPCGALDGLAAIRVIGTRRSDVRVLANADLVSIAELTPLLLAVDPGIGRSDTARNAQALRKAWRWLVEEHALVVFPACGVAHFDARAGCVTDPPWNPVIGRLIKQTASPVVPLHFAGRNSTLFQLVGLLAPPLRTLLLRGELRRRRASRVDVHVGESIARERLGQFESPEALALHLRLRTLLAPATNQSHTAASIEPRNVELIPAAMPVDCLEREIGRLEPESRLLAHGPMTAHVAHAEDIPHLLSEIGRLRELTGRDAGEGSGRGRNLDHFDAHYEHLFIWHSVSRQIVAACRLARSDDIRRRFGRRGLYTSTLFNYSDLFFRLLGPALEVGRCFVRREFQRDPAPLMLLWKGIAEFSARQGYLRLIGPANISGDYLDISKHLIVDFLRSQRFDPLLGWLVRARHPFARSASLRSLASELAMLGAVDPLAALIEDLEPDGKSVPVLLRQYLKFGGRVLGFNVDENLNRAIDCLVLVDLKPPVQPPGVEAVSGGAAGTGAGTFASSARSRWSS